MFIWVLAVLSLRHCFADDLLSVSLFLPGRVLRASFAALFCVTQSFETSQAQFCRDCGYVNWRHRKLRKTVCKMRFLGLCVRLRFSFTIIYMLRCGIISSIFEHFSCLSIADNEKIRFEGPSKFNWTKKISSSHLWEGLGCVTEAAISLCDGTIVDEHSCTVKCSYLESC